MYYYEYYFLNVIKLNPSLDLIAFFQEYQTESDYGNSDVMVESSRSIHKECSYLNSMHTF